MQSGCEQLIGKRLTLHYQFRTNNNFNFFTTMDLRN